MAEGQSTERWVGQIGPSMSFNCSAWSVARKDVAGCNVFKVGRAQLAKERYDPLENPYPLDATGVKGDTEDAGRGVMDCARDGK